MEHKGVKVGSGPKAFERPKEKKGEGKMLPRNLANVRYTEGPKVGKRGQLRQALKNPQIHQTGLRKM